MAMKDIFISANVEPSGGATSSWQAQGPDVPPLGSFAASALLLALLMNGVLLLPLLVIAV